MATPAEVFHYTSLPAEIRNAIMEYALVPGDVYPCVKEPKPKSTNPSRKLLRAVFKVRVGGVDHRVSTKQPGFQLLTTCKEAYQDGHFMFYTMNTFHLPAGSARDAEEWFNDLKPDHRSTIKSACMTFSLADITPDCLAEMEKIWLFDIPLKTRQLERRMAFEVTYLLCWRYWQEKIRFLQKWDTLEKVELKTGSATFAFDGDEFRALDAKEERRIMDLARGEVKTELEGMVDEMGWKAAKKLLMTRTATSGV